MNKGHSQVTALYCTRAPDVHRYVAIRFPRLSEDQVGDAVSDAFEVLIRQPALVEGALREGGDRALAALLRVIAWRFARATTRRACYGRELSLDGSLPATGYQEPDQEFLAHVLHNLEGALAEAVEGVSCSRPQALAAAVMDRMLCPITDEEAALRHGVRREQVNRARACVARTMLN